MFQLLTTTVAGISILFSYRYNKNLIQTGGKIGTVYKISATLITLNNIKNAVQDEYKVAVEKETFGSTAAFLTGVTTANIVGNFLMYKNLEISELGVAGNSYATTTYGVTKFIIGLNVVPMVTKYTSISASSVFDSNETFEKFVGNGKLEFVTKVGGSLTVVLAGAEVATKIVNVNDNVKIALVAILTPLAFNCLPKNISINMVAEQENKIAGEISGNDE